MPTPLSSLLPPNFPFHFRVPGSPLFILWSCPSILFVVPPGISLPLCQVVRVFYHSHFQLYRVILKSFLCPPPPIYPMLVPNILVTFSVILIPLNIPSCLITQVHNSYHLIPKMWSPQGLARTRSRAEASYIDKTLHALANSLLHPFYSLLLLLQT